MNTLVGTGALVRLALRRDRIMLPVWLAVFVLMAMSAAAGTVQLYPTAGSWVGPAEIWNHSQSLVALYGRVYDSTSVGSFAVVKPLGTMAAILAVFAIILVVRHTRAEEESGRLAHAQDAGCRLHRDSDRHAHRTGRPAHRCGVGRLPPPRHRLTLRTFAIERRSCEFWVAGAAQNSQDPLSRSVPSSRERSTSSC